MTEHEVRVRFLTDWCRRDPDVGLAQLQREDAAVAQEVRERFKRGPQVAPTVWEILRVMIEEAKAARKGRR